MGQLEIVGKAQMMGKSGKVRQRFIIICDLVDKKTERNYITRGKNLMR
jgi:hypothetical protein